ncbi:hypothetical protein [Actinophytocola sp.]|uniref:hypothetical protein n=1 Tax=Actinophytocola sp. TaxID=1872138 RepID=UPI002ED43AC4
MDSGLATQLITVGATLSGVVLTMLGSVLLEGRRAREAHRLESVRLSAEHAKWLREERTKAYAAFSLAAEDALRLLRDELAPSLHPDTLPRYEDAVEAWRELRIDMRKVYNQVMLLGADEPRTVALRVWRLTRDSSTDLLGDISRGELSANELAARGKEIRARLGGEVNNFLTACRADLQGGSGLA